MAKSEYVLQRLAEIRANQLPHDGEVRILGSRLATESKLKAKVKEDLEARTRRDLLKAIEEERNRKRRASPGEQVLDDESPVDVQEHKRLLAEERAPRNPQPGGSEEGQRSSDAALADQIATEGFTVALGPVAVTDHWASLLMGRSGETEFLAGPSPYAANRDSRHVYEDAQREVSSRMRDRGIRTRASRLASLINEQQHLQELAGEQSSQASRRQAERSKKWRKENPEHWTAIQNANNAYRYAAERRQCPPWADVSEILSIYYEARQRTVSTGRPHEVDHIIPLRGRYVSGLHVASNLQIVEQDANRTKRASFRPYWEVLRRDLR